MSLCTLSCALSVTGSGLLRGAARGLSFSPWFLSSHCFQKGFQAVNFMVNFWLISGIVQLAWVLYTSWLGGNNKKSGWSWGNTSTRKCQKDAECVPVGRKRGVHWPCPASLLSSWVTWQLASTRGGDRHHLYRIYLNTNPTMLGVMESVCSVIQACVSLVRVKHGSVSALLLQQQGITRTLLEAAYLEVVVLFQLETGPCSEDPLDYL